MHRLARLAGLLIGFTAASALAADDPTKPQTQQATPAGAAAKGAAPANVPAKPKPAPAKPKTAAQVAAERETAALAFARQHHPELLTLIDKLRKENRREYNMAIRDLSQASDRLTRLKKQSPAQYDVALAAWKLDSRAHLLAARMTMTPDPAMEAELKQVLRERVDLRLKEYKFERDRIQQRLATLGTLIHQIETDPAVVAQKDFNRVKQLIARNRRPAAKKPAQSPAKTDTPAKPVVAERPQRPNARSAASVVPTGDSSPGSSKPKSE
jgi:hypothetical protein